MFEIIINIVNEHSKLAGGLTLFLCIAILLTYKFTKFFLRTNKITEEFPAIQITLNKIDKALTTLNQVLIEKSVITQSCYSNENSPRAVNSLGEELYQQSGANKVFDEIKNPLIERLEKEKYNSLLELERKCVDLLLSMMNEPVFSSVQNFAFEHPTFKGNPLTYTDILFVMSLKLRDMYRTKHSEIRE